jgi:hypothetical protein
VLSPESAASVVELHSRGMVTLSPNWPEQDTANTMPSAFTKDQRQIISTSRQFHCSNFVRIASAPCYSFQFCDNAMAFKVLWFACFVPSVVTSSVVPANHGIHLFRSPMASSNFASQEHRHCHKGMLLKH